MDNLNSLFETIKKSAEEISKPFAEFYSKDRVVSTFKVISGELSVLGQSLSSLYSNVDFDGISKALKQLQELIDGVYGKETALTYQKWGEYGWCYSPSVDTYFFSKIIGKKNADEEMKVYCNEQELLKIYNILSASTEYSNILSNAKKCFDNEIYDACCLLLFSIIDNKLFAYGFKKRNGDVKTGKSAVQSLLSSKTENNIAYQKNYECSVRFVNIVSTLLKMYEFGNNFQEPMTIVNRNYLAHGQSNRAIDKKDCYQVWFATYCTVYLLDEIDSFYQNEVKEKEEE